VSLISKIRKEFIQLSLKAHMKKPKKWQWTKPSSLFLYISQYRFWEGPQSRKSILSSFYLWS